MERKHPAEYLFSSRHPLASYLQIAFLGEADGVLSVRVTAPDLFVTDRQSGTVHTGLATLALDTVFGSAVLGAMEVPQPIATTGLTTQHMRRPVAGETLICQARVEGIHHEIAHVSGRLVVEASGEVLSIANGTFMVGTRSKPLGVRL